MQLTQARAVSESPLGAVDAVANGALKKASLEWLTWLGSRLPLYQSLALYAVKNNSAQMQVTMPANTAFDARHAKLSLSCVESEKVLVSRDTAPGNLCTIAVPLTQKRAESQRVLVFYGPTLSGDELKSTVNLIRWAAFYLRSSHSTVAQQKLWAKTHGEIDGLDGLARSVLRAIETSNSFSALCISVVNTVARLSSSVRVSLGCASAKQATVLAISGHAQVEAKRSLVQQIGAAMQCSLLDSPIAYPFIGKNSGVSSHTTLDCPDSDAFVAQKELFERSGLQPNLAIMLGGNSRQANGHRYVVLLEAAPGHQFSKEQADAIDVAVAPLANLLTLYADNEAPWYSQAWQKLCLPFKPSNDSAPWSVKTMLTWGLPATIAILAFVPIEHRVSAHAYIEAADRQVVVAPQAGYIFSSHARAGDKVEKGTVLATMDGHELSLEADKWRTEQAKNAQSFQQALATHDRAELSRLRADAARINAEILQIEQQLSRAQLRAPFSGVLLSGDLTQMLGAPVKQGQVLYEIGSAEQYRLIVEVDEHDIGFVEANQSLSVRMSSLPSAQWKATVEQVLPVAVAEQGKSVFRLPANIEGNSSKLKPGMQGVAKIYIGDRGALWVWAHTLVDRIKFIAWKVGLY